MLESHSRSKALAFKDDVKVNCSEVTYCDSIRPFPDSIAIPYPRFATVWLSALKLLPFHFGNRLSPSMQYLLRQGTKIDIHDLPWQAVDKEQHIVCTSCVPRIDYTGWLFQEVEYKIQSHHSIPKHKWDLEVEGNSSITEDRESGRHIIYSME